MGFPQGGVCSAKFWLVAFNNAIKIINSGNIEGNGYADDCSAVLGGKRLDHIVINMEKMLKNLVEWGNSCKLRFNPAKTVAVLFTRKRREPTDFVQFENKVLPYSKEVRYLGITLDAKLHWKEHIEDRITRAKKLSLIHI